MYYVDYIYINMKDYVEIHRYVEAYHFGVTATMGIKIKY